MAGMRHRTLAVKTDQEGYLLDGHLHTLVGLCPLDWRHRLILHIKCKLPCWVKSRLSWVWKWSKVQCQTCSILSIHPAPLGRDGAALM